MTNISLILILFLLSFSDIDNGPSNSCILWTQDYKLKWDDFQGIPDSTRTYHQQSATKTSIEVTTKIESRKIIYTVSCYFDKEKSWTINHTSKSILAHEQLHFDIAEIYARNLRKKLFELKKISNSDLEKKVKEIYHEIISTCIQYQLKYDDETNHSKDKKNQHIWNDRIKEILNQTNEYNSILVTVPNNKNAL